MLGIVFVIISNIFAIIPAQVVRYSFDLIKESVDRYRLYEGLAAQEQVYDTFASSILLYGGIIVVMALLRGVFLFYMRQTIIVMSRLIENDLKNDVYAHYQVLPLSFYRRNSTGDLMARISEDVNRVRMYLGPVIMYGINLFVLFTLVVGYMISVSPRLTFFVLLPLPFLSLGIYYVNSIIERKSDQLQKQLSSLTTYVQEAFSGIRVLKSYVREKVSV